MNTNNRQESENTVAVYRPKLSFYHPNGKGTGSAVKLSLYPAQNDVEGCIMLAIANQMTTGNVHSSPPVFPRFDWENAICVKLDFNDLSKILQVLRGESESIDDGHGLYHRTSNASTRILLRHMLEPIQGYSLELYRTMVKGGADVNARLIFSNAEATGLCEAISGSMAVISFGIPMLPKNGRDVKSPEGGRDVAAA